MKKYLILLVITTLGACTSIHNGIYSSSAEISKGNFKYVDIAEGESKEKYFFGIGGFKSDGLVKDAKKSMYQNANLQPNQIIANVTVDVKTSFYFLILWIERKAYVTGDVIEFTDSDSSSINPKSAFFNKLNSSEIPRSNVTTSAKDNIEKKIEKKKVVTNSKYKLGDKVNIRINNVVYTGTVAELTNDYAVIEYEKNGKIKTRRLYF